MRKSGNRDAGQWTDSGRRLTRSQLEYTSDRGTPSLVCCAAPAPRGLLLDCHGLLGLLTLMRSRSSRRNFTDPLRLLINQCLCWIFAFLDMGQSRVGNWANLESASTRLCISGISSHRGLLKKQVSPVTGLTPGSWRRLMLIYRGV